MYSSCRGMPSEPKAILHALYHYALQAKIILADINLAVSTQTAMSYDYLKKI